MSVLLNPAISCFVDAQMTNLAYLLRGWGRVSGEKIGLPQAVPNNRKLDYAYRDYTCTLFFGTFLTMLSYKLAEQYYSLPMYLKLLKPTLQEHRIYHPPQILERFLVGEGNEPENNRLIPKRIEEEITLLKQRHEMVTELSPHLTGWQKFAYNVNRCLKPRQYDPVRIQADIHSLERLHPAMVKAFTPEVYLANKLTELGSEEQTYVTDHLTDFDHIVNAFHKYKARSRWISFDELCKKYPTDPNFTAFLSAPEHKIKLDDLVAKLKELNPNHANIRDSLKLYLKDPYFKGVQPWHFIKENPLSPRVAFHKYKTALSLSEHPIINVLRHCQPQEFDDLINALKPIVEKVQPLTLQSEEADDYFWHIIRKAAPELHRDMGYKNYEKMADQFHTIGIIKRLKAAFWDWIRKDLRKGRYFWPERFAKNVITFIIDPLAKERASEGSISEAAQTILKDALESKLNAVRMQKIFKSNNLFIKIPISLIFTSIFWGWLSNNFDTQTLQPFQRKLVAERGDATEFVNPIYLSTIPALATFPILGALPGIKHLPYALRFAVQVAASFGVYSFATWAQFKKIMASPRKQPVKHDQKNMFTNKPGSSPPPAAKLPPINVTPAWTAGPAVAPKNPFQQPATTYPTSIPAQWAYPTAATMNRGSTYGYGYYPYAR